MESSLVSVIIVNWNGQKWLAGCLAAVFRQTHKDIEVIIVDNNSTDESIDFIKNNYPAVIIVKNDKNEGFGEASNIGVTKAKGDILFFLNNDTLMEKNVVVDLLQEKETKKVNIIGPKILDFNNHDIYQGRKLSIDCTGYLGWGKETFYVEGCAMIIGKKDFLILGGFDEKYFMYSEDIDLCWRALLFGMKIAISDKVNVVHYGGGSSGSTQLHNGERHVVPILRKYEVEKNNLRNLLKNYSSFNLLWTVPAFLGQSFFESMVYLLTGNFRAFIAIGKAILWNISNINDTMQKRRLVQLRRKIRDLKILKKINLWTNKIQALRVTGFPRFK